MGGGGEAADASATATVFTLEAGSGISPVRPRRTPPAAVAAMESDPPREKTYEELAAEKKAERDAIAAKLKAEAMARIKARQTAEEAERAAAMEAEQDDEPSALAYEPCTKILEALRDAKDEEGNLYSEYFAKLPMKHSSKGKKYFKLTSKPICLDDMFRDVKKKYNTLSHLRLDFERLYDNNHRFHTTFPTLVTPQHVTALAAFRDIFYPLFKQAMEEGGQQIGYYRFPAEDEFIEEVDVEDVNKLTAMVPLLVDAESEPYEPGGVPYGPVAMAEEKIRKEALTKALAMTARSDPSWVCFARNQAEFDQWLADNATAKSKVVKILRAQFNYGQLPADEVDVDADETHAGTGSSKSGGYTFLSGY
jgi:hypothetical protein